MALLTHPLTPAVFHPTATSDTPSRATPWRASGRSPLMHWLLAVWNGACAQAERPGRRVPYC